MSGFLQRLADRSFGRAEAKPALAPRRPSIFEPEGGLGLGLGPGPMSLSEAGGSVEVDAGEESGEVGPRIGRTRLAPREARGAARSGAASPPGGVAGDVSAVTVVPVVDGRSVARRRGKLAQEPPKLASSPMVASASAESAVFGSLSTPSTGAPSADFLAGLTGRGRRSSSEPSRGEFAPPTPDSLPPSSAESPMARVGQVDGLLGVLGGPRGRAMAGGVGAPLLAGAHSPEAHSPPVASEPVVHVTIGRIEVRSASEKPTKPRRPRRPAAPRLSLDDYQRRRREGGR